MHRQDFLLKGVGMALVLAWLQKSSPAVRNMGTGFHRGPRICPNTGNEAALGMFPPCASCFSTCCDGLLSITPGLPIIFAAHSLKELSDITDWYLKECLCHYLLSPLFYQVLRVKHMLKYFAGSRPILTHRNQSRTARNGQRMMG